MLTSTLIRNSRNRLFEKGWSKGIDGDTDGPNCAVGAIKETAWEMITQAGIDPYGPEKNRLINDGIRQLESVIGHSWVPAWNDDPKTTFNEVIEVFEKAEKFALIGEEN